MLRRDFHMAKLQHDFHVVIKLPHVLMPHESLRRKKYVVK